MVVLFKLLLFLAAVFLILLVLVQRGRGGGLAGALGGRGGSSAFGAKAGDVFTRISIVAAFVWIVLCIAATRIVPSGGSNITLGNPDNAGAAMSGTVDGDAEGESTAVDDAASASAEGNTPDTTSAGSSAPGASASTESEEPKQGEK